MSETVTQPTPATNPQPTDPETKTKPTETTLPGDWKTKDDEGKLVWLAGQPLPSHPHVNLATCYHNGNRIVHWTGILHQALLGISHQFKDDKDNGFRQAIADFITSFNVGMATFAKHVAKDCADLLDFGKYSPHALPIQSAEKLRKIDFDFNDPSKVKPLWDTAAEALSTLCAEIPQLKEIRPGMASSFYQLLDGFVKAGQQFFTLLDKKQKKVDKEKNSIPITYRQRDVELIPFPKLIAPPTLRIVEVNNADVSQVV